MLYEVITKIAEEMAKERPKFIEGAKASYNFV